MQDIVKISGLEPMIEPEPIAFWPPEPGWYILITLILAFICYGIYIYFRKQQKNKYRKSALKALDLIKAEATETSYPEAVKSLNTLLKRTALSGFPREDVAQLSGEAWQNFLTATCTQTNFSSDQGKLLTEASFRCPKDIKVNASSFTSLTALCMKWIKQHKS